MKSKPDPPTDPVEEAVSKYESEGSAGQYEAVVVPVTPETFDQIEVDTATVED